MDVPADPLACLAYTAHYLSGAGHEGGRTTDGGQQQQQQAGGSWAAGGPLALSLGAAAGQAGWEGVLREAEGELSGDGMMTDSEAEAEEGAGAGAGPGEEVAASGLRGGWGPTPAVQGAAAGGGPWAGRWTGGGSGPRCQQYAYGSTSDCGGDVGDSAGRGGSTDGGTSGGGARGGSSGGRGGRTPGGARSKRPDGRRPVQYWATFNEWWRSELERSGRRPGVEAIVEWHRGHAAAVWGAEAPGVEETRTHAKCLRSVGSIREYFREYRAKKRAKTDEYPHGPPSHGGCTLSTGTGGGGTSALPPGAGDLGRMMSPGGSGGGGGLGLPPLPAMAGHVPRAVYQHQPPPPPPVHHHQPPGVALGQGYAAAAAPPMSFQATMAAVAAAAAAALQSARNAPAGPASALTLSSAMLPGASAAAAAAAAAASSPRGGALGQGRCSPGGGGALLGSGELSLNGMGSLGSLSSISDALAAALAAGPAAAADGAPQTAAEGPTAAFQAAATPPLLRATPVGASHPSFFAGVPSAAAGQHVPPHAPGPAAQPLGSAAACASAAVVTTGSAPGSRGTSMAGAAAPGAVPGAAPGGAGGPAAAGAAAAPRPPTITTAVSPTAASGGAAQDGPLPGAPGSGTACATPEARSPREAGEGRAPGAAPQREQPQPQPQPQPQRHPALGRGAADAGLPPKKWRGLGYSAGELPQQLLSAFPQADGAAVLHISLPGHAPPPAAEDAAAPAAAAPAAEGAPVAAAEAQAGAEQAALEWEAAASPRGAGTTGPAAAAPPGEGGLAPRPLYAYVPARHARLVSSPFTVAVQPARPPAMLLHAAGPGSARPVQPYPYYVPARRAAAPLAGPGEQQAPRPAHAHAHAAVQLHPYAVAWGRPGGAASWQPGPHAGHSGGSGGEGAQGSSPRSDLTGGQEGGRGGPPPRPFGGVPVPVRVTSASAAYTRSQELQQQALPGGSSPRSTAGDGQAAGQGATAARAAQEAGTPDARACAAASPRHGVEGAPAARATSVPSQYTQRAGRTPELRGALEATPSPRPGSPRSALPAPSPAPSVHGGAGGAASLAGPGTGTGAPPRTPVGSTGGTDYLDGAGGASPPPATLGVLPHPSGASAGGARSVGGAAAGGGAGGCRGGAPSLRWLLAQPDGEVATVARSLGSEALVAVVVRLLGTVRQMREHEEQMAEELAQAMEAQGGLQAQLHQQRAECARMYRQLVVAARDMRSSGGGGGGGDTALTAPLAGGGGDGRVGRALDGSSGGAATHVTAGGGDAASGPPLPLVRQAPVLRPAASPVWWDGPVHPHPHSHAWPGYGGYERGAGSEAHQGAPAAGRSLTGDSGRLGQGVGVGQAAPHPRYYAGACVQAHAYPQHHQHQHHSASHLYQGQPHHERLEREGAGGSQGGAPRAAWLWGSAGGSAVSPEAAQQQQQQQQGLEGGGGGELPPRGAWGERGEAGAGEEVRRSDAPAPAALAPRAAEGPVYGSGGEEGGQGAREAPVGRSAGGAAAPAAGGAAAAAGAAASAGGSCGGSGVVAMEVCDAVGEGERRECGDAGGAAGGDCICSDGGSGDSTAMRLAA